MVIVKTADAIEALKLHIYTGQIDKFKRLYSSIEIVNLEISREILRGSRDENFSLIHSAACQRWGDKVIEYLIEKGGDINWRNNKGKTALWYALDRDNYKVVKYLLKNGARETNLVECMKISGSMSARLLLEYADDKTQRDEYGRTILHVNTTIYECLDKETFRELFLVKDCDGETPLDVAYEAGIESFVSFLRAAGGGASVELVKYIRMMNEEELLEYIKQVSDEDLAYLIRNLINPEGEYGF